MTSHKPKILVLCDLKKSFKDTLKSSVSLAKLIDGEVTVFNAQNPNHVVEKDNQLSAIRAINHNYISTNKILEESTKRVSSDSKINVNYEFKLGVVKDEIAKFVNAFKPDVIVIGKRKSKFINFSGDNLTNFLLDSYSGPILVTRRNHKLREAKSMSLGILDQTSSPKARDIFEKLRIHTEKPIKSFKIGSDANKTETNNTFVKNSMVEFVFEKNSNSIQNLSYYLEKNAIDLLYLDRTSHDTKTKGKTNQELSKLILKLNVPLLLLSNTKIQTA